MDIAELLGISCRVVHRLVDSGELQAFQLGGAGSAVVIVAASFDALVDRRIKIFQADRGIDGSNGR